MVHELSNALPTQYQQFIHKGRYARWLPGEKRREEWTETVGRYKGYWSDLAPENDVLRVEFEQALEEAAQAIVALEDMPSMRCMMTAGPALKRDNMAGFNCAYQTMHRQRAYDEMMYVLMCGTGVGYSVERKYTTKLPRIAETHYDSETVISVGDSKIGWASAFREVVSLLYMGKVPKWDTSKVRAKGEPLTTFGGRASGPEPLEALFAFCVNTFRRFAGRQLPSIAVHDICCKIADAVVVGGVRRSACICLTDRDDEYMAKAKSPVKVIEYTLLGHNEDGKRKYSTICDDAPYGERSLIIEVDDWESEQLQKGHTINWWHIHPQRALANISIAYESKPNDEEFIYDWSNLIASHSGERGIFNRRAAQRQASTNGRRDPDGDYGTNPCAEIILRDRQVCNLTELILRAGDTLDDIRRKVKHAAFLGTLQSTQTNFRYLSSKWKQNSEEERLLGVSMTGIYDHPVMSGKQSPVDARGFGSHQDLPAILRELRQLAQDTNIYWAKILGIQPSTAITCVKPSGTVSQLVDSASGIHARHSEYYIRTVRADIKDPLSKFMVEAGFPYEPEIKSPDSTLVFAFPMKVEAPHAEYRDNLKAIDHLKLWSIYNEHWCEHKPSITVYVRPGEWMQVGAHVYDNFEDFSGVSFLPYDGGNYQQAPYQEITKEKYEELNAAMPADIDWAELSRFEEKDMTAGSQSLACTGGVCEMVDL